jgi:hypothetical protein
MSERCQHVKADGERCRAAALAGKALCFAHDPDSAGRRREARSAGGRARLKPRTVLPPNTPDVPLKSVADVLAAVEQLFNQVRTGRVDSKVGNCLAVIAGLQLKAIVGEDIERRLAALEQQAERRRPR